MSTAASVANVGDLLAVRSYVAGVDGVAFETSARFREEFPCGAPFAAYI